MDSTQRRAAEVTTPLKSAAGDLGRMKSSSSASVQELKDFLKKHSGKRSQELLGELGKTSLFQAMIKSTVGCFALLVVLTVVPYFVQGKGEVKKSNHQGARASSTKAVQVGEQGNSKPGDIAAPANDSRQQAPEGVDVDQAKKKLGLDETKAAPESVNPREKDLDNLLDGVK